MEANLNNSIGPNSYTSYRIASDLLNELDNLSLTTPIDTILFEYEIKTCPFSLIKAHVPSNSPIFKTAGALVEFKDNYYILYDDNDSIQRIRWTKGHELGHFFLKHPFDNLENYSIYETEANYFASQLLLPLELLLVLDYHYYLTENLLSVVCNQTLEACKYRIRYYKKYKHTFKDLNLNEQLMEKYADLIKKHVLTNTKFKEFNCLKRNSL